jgi:hypothetical protein
MDLEPVPLPEPYNAVPEDETERGISLPFMNDEEEDAEEYGVDGFRWLNGELLRPLDEEAAITRFTQRQTC